jgi:predicted MFS family arabinose efflux permease
MLFAAIFTAELGWGGISPLLPTYQDVYGLTDVATGLILTLASIGILLVCLPAGSLSNRFAVRTLTLWSLAALTIGNVVVGLSDSYVGLLAGRVVFGVGLGVMWVTGTAWLHEAAGDHAPRALALTTSIVGAANLIGPGIIGWVADRFSVGTPFVLLSCLTGVVLVILVLAPSTEGRTVGSDPPLREMLRAARGDHLMLTSLVITLAVAVMWMSAELLLALRLDVHGFDASEIGLAFSASSGVFLIASAVTSARAERYATIRFAAVWTAVFAASVLIPAFGTGVVVTLVFLMTMSITTGVLISLTYPLGAAGAARGGYNVAVVGVLLTLVWSGAGLVGPTAGAVASERLDDRVWFVGLAGFGLAAAAWMWLRRDVRRRTLTPVADDEPLLPRP